MGFLTGINSSDPETSQTETNTESSEDEEDQEYENARRIISTLHKHRTTRDGMVKEYQVLWYKFKHWYNNRKEDLKVMSWVAFEVKFKEKYRTLSKLAEEIKHYYDIFDEYSN